MDQFCALKNDDYRRCSCSDRIYNLAEHRELIQTAGEKLTVFTENLDIVGLSAQQATAMISASDGESALTKDTSASKALLQAIMNSIRGDDTTVGGKYTDLNSINIAFDASNAFGITDAGQAIANNNGQELYKAVYPQCRDAVRADCNDNALQRAITAYLMAIEQDCNTVQTAIEQKRKEAKSAVRESSAMLDLARIENRQKHNSSDFATCLNEVEAAILSEEVCGANYHKCLDNGEYIDVSTGEPIAGVVKFYELENLLTFNDTVDATKQKLSKVLKNQNFLQKFETKTKKFAEEALDKCVEKADEVWSQYLDIALLDIYYAQRDKVKSIKNKCFSYVSKCYMGSETSLDNAIEDIKDENSIVLNPDLISLNTAMCRDYIDSCNNMFDDNIVAQYIQERQDTDTLTACRAVAKQCFDKFGSTNYENFYYPYSGLFTPYDASAIKWFTLYDYTQQGCSNINDTNYTDCIASTCAKQMAQITTCNSREMLETAFGGMDYIPVEIETPEKDNINNKYIFDPASSLSKYGIITTNNIVTDRGRRPTGVATEIYNQILDTLTTQCMNLQGRFIEPQFTQVTNYDRENMCLSKFDETSSRYNNLVETYKIGGGEDMCPRDYRLDVDTNSWGACICWENGGRRSKWGKSTKCTPSFATDNGAKKDKQCDNTDTIQQPTKDDTTIDHWCTQNTNTDNQVLCPPATTTDCNDETYKDLPKGLDN